MIQSTFKIQKIHEILQLLGCNETENDLLKVLSSLKGEVEKVVNFPETTEQTVTVENVELLDLAGITDEKQILEVCSYNYTKSLFISILLPQVKLKNSETLYENAKNQCNKIGLTLKEKERKITQLSCHLTTAEVRSKLLEEQVTILEKDLKQQNVGTSDNLTDAIEV